jgi:hypothetical protein
MEEDHDRARFVVGMGRPDVEREAPALADRHRHALAEGVFERARQLWCMGRHGVGEVHAVDRHRWLRAAEAKLVDGRCGVCDSQEALVTIVRRALDTPGLRDDHGSDHWSSSPRRGERVARDASDSVDSVVTNRVARVVKSEAK